VTTVLITGAGGHIGQRLTRRLASQGFMVRAQVRRPLSWPADVEQVVGDLVAQHGLAAELVAGVDAVIHLAGANELALSREPERAVAESVTAAERIAAVAARVVYLSTVHVYGAALVPGAIITEDTRTEPLTPYSVARLACEDVFRASGGDVTVCRLTNGLGAPLSPDSPGWRVVSNELCRDGATKGRLNLRTSGVQWRDFVALDDVESAVAALVATDHTGTFNVASGTSITIRQLAVDVQRSFERVAGLDLPLHMPPVGEEHPPAYRVDNASLASLGLFTPTTRDDALDEVVRYCLEHRDALAAPEIEASRQA
jgi:UDP-glucose 4-epimerase